MREGLLIGAALGAAFIGTLAYHWHRRRRAGQLADDLLAAVIKEKDAFRRRD
jgi:hypothetical protein